MTKDIPEPWASAFTRAKMTDPRNGAPSMRAVAQAIGSNPSTISDMVHGRRNPSVTTIEQIAKVLNVSATTVTVWVGEARSTVRPYSPPAEASYLTARQRKALDELIRAMTAQEARHDRQGDTQQGPEAGSTVDGSEDRAEDGSTAGRRQTPMSADDNVHHLDQGKLQPPPPAEKSAAWRTRNRGKEIREQQDRDE